MRAKIIFHSVSGNLYLIASCIKEALIKEGIDARLYRIEDHDLHLLAADRNDVNEYYEDILALPPAKNEKLLNADIIMVGIKSVFGMPSAEMKAFLDGTMDLYEKRSLEGKYFYPFATSSISYKDSLDAIEAVENWAHLMGLVSLDYPPYMHKDGLMMPSRPGEELEITTSRLASAVKSVLS